MRGKHPKVGVFRDPVAEYLRGPLAGNMRGKHPEVGIFREPVAEDIRGPLAGNVRGVLVPHDVLIITEIYPYMMHQGIMGCLPR